MTHLHKLTPLSTKMPTFYKLCIALAIISNLHVKSLLIVLPLFHTLVFCTNEGFLTSSYLKNFTVSLPSHARSCHFPCQRMAAFYTFVNHVLNICSDTILFNIEIQYLKAIALDRAYNPSIVDKVLFKLRNPRLLHPSHFNSNIDVI